MTAKQTFEVLRSEFRNGLTEIDVNPAVVDDDAIHLEIGAFAGGRVVELDERVLQRATRPLFVDHFAAAQFSKSHICIVHSHTIVTCVKKE